MPAFFILSGYLYKPQKWYKTLKCMLIPILFFIHQIYILYFKPIFKRGGIELKWNLIERCFLPFLKTNVSNEITLFSGIWFLICLIFCRLICGVFYKYKSYKCIYYLAIAAFIYMATEQLWINNTSITEWFIYRTIACFPFFAFGIAIKQIPLRIPTVKTSISITLGSIFCISAILQKPIEMYSGTYGYNYLFFSLVELLGSFLLFTFCSKQKENTLFTTFSTGTLLILGAHKIIINITETLFNKLEIQNNIILPYFFSCMVMTIAYFPIKWCIKYCPILLGK